MNPESLIEIWIRFQAFNQVPPNIAKILTLTHMPLNIESKLPYYNYRDTQLRT